MFSLIKNELGKIFAKKANWIYMIVLVAFVLLGGFITDKIYGEPDENWREHLQAEINELEQQKAELPEEDQEWYNMVIQENQNYLDEDINPDAHSNWDFMNGTIFGIMGMLVPLFAVIVSSASVSAEFADGTIKQLLIRPHRRWKVLLSKYFSVLIYSLTLLLVLLVSGYIVGTIIFGSGDFNAKVFEMNMDLQQELVVVGEQFLLKVLYHLPSLLMYITIAFMLSTLFKNQALAVGVGVFVLFLSSTIGGIIILLAEKFTWTKYLIFPHLDLTIYTYEDTILQDVTMPISLLVLAVHYIVFMVLTFTFFQKRDISI